jgi:small subunit ribosomal protein S20
LANTKSAIKNVRKSRRRRVRNQVFRSKAKTAVKKARVLIHEGQKETAHEAVRAAHSALDKAAAKGILHKNNAARRKARLMRQFNQTFES